MIKYIFLLLLLVACAEKKVRTSSPKDETQAIMYLAMKEMLKFDIIKKSKNDFLTIGPSFEIVPRNKLERIRLNATRDSIKVAHKNMLDTMTFSIVLNEDCWHGPISNWQSNEVYQFRPKKTVNKNSEFYQLSQKVFNNQNDSMLHKCDTYFRYPKLTIVVKGPDFTRETNQIGWLCMSQIEYNSKIDRAALYLTYEEMSAGCIPSSNFISFLFLLKKQNNTWKVVDKVDCKHWQRVLIKSKNVSHLKLPF